MLNEACTLKNNCGVLVQKWVSNVNDQVSVSTKSVCQICIFDESRCGTLEKISLCKMTILPDGIVMFCTENDKSIIADDFDHSPIPESHHSNSQRYVANCYGQWSYCKINQHFTTTGAVAELRHHSNKSNHFARTDAESATALLSDYRENWLCRG